MKEREEHHREYLKLLLEKAKAAYTEGNRAVYNIERPNGVVREVLVITFDETFDPRESLSDDEIYNKAERYAIITYNTMYMCRIKGPRLCDIDTTYEKEIREEMGDE